VSLLSFNPLLVLFRNPSTDYEKINVRPEDPIFMDESEIKRAIGEKVDYLI